MSESSPLKYASMALWFFAAPLALAGLVVWTLKGGVPGPGPFGQLRWLVQDQPVPALIVFFTAFEMVLYQLRHYLPFASGLGRGVGADVPAAHRREVEEALHLGDEVEGILAQHARKVEREVTSGERERLRDALDRVREVAMRRPLDADALVDAHDDLRTQAQRLLAPWRKSELREYVESIGVAFAVALALRAFVVEAFKIPSGSMLPTLQLQDHIFVNKFVYGPTVPQTKHRLWNALPPKRGDVMVFEYPNPDPTAPREDYIKRVIALPGDTLEVEDGHPIINGWSVPRCRVGDYDFHEGEEPLKHGELWMEFLGEYSYLTLFQDGRTARSDGPYHVDPEEVWVLGDNRNNSQDSRVWGGAPFANIKGRAMFVWLSFGADGNLTTDRLLHNVLGAPTLPQGAPPSLLAAIDQCVKHRPAVTDPPPPKAP